MNKNEKDVYIIGHPKMYYYITKNAGIILVFSFIMIFLVALILQVDFSYLKRLIIIILTYTAIGLFFIGFFNKVAWKITIDYDQSKIFFYMCRTKEIKNYNLNSIEDIALNFYTKFTFENEVILCNFVKDKTFMNNIIKLKRINNLT